MGLPGGLPPIEPIPAAAFPRPAEVPANGALGTARGADLAALGIVMRPWEEALADCVAEILAAERGPQPTFPAQP